MIEWGYVTVDPYPDVIAGVLRCAGRPLAYGELFQRVSAIRSVKGTSLTMNLNLHPRFYTASDGSFGLRVWLPVREKQTLLTPDHLVETAASLRRVEKAKARRYDVDRIVDEDRMREPSAQKPR